MRRRQASSPLDRVFAVVSTPWPAVAGLVLLAGLHWLEVQRLLQGAAGLWSVDSLRAVGVGVVAASGLAMGAARLRPALGLGGGGAEGVAADLAAPAQDVDLGLLGIGRRPRYEGALAAAGALLLFVGLLGYAGSPLFRGAGLVRGGELVLTPGAPAEAAVVLREGLAVRENLGGWRFEIDRIDVGALDGRGEGPAQIFLRVTRVQTGEVTEAVLRQDQLLQLGELRIALEALAPAPQPAGVWVTVTDREASPPRSFDLKLTAGRTLADPAGPGRFQLRRIEEGYLGGEGTAAQGVVQLEGEEAQEFWIFEKAPGYDARHRGGRYAVSFKELVPGHLVTARLSQPEPASPIPAWIVCLCVGTFLLSARPQLSAVKIGAEGEERVLVSSLNEGERAARALVGALLPPDEDAPSEEEA